MQAAHLEYGCGKEEVKKGRQASLPPCPELGELVGALHLLLAGTLQSGTGQVGWPLCLSSLCVDLQKNSVPILGLVECSALFSPSEFF